MDKRSLRRGIIPCPASGIWSAWISATVSVPSLPELNQGLIRISGWGVRLSFGVEGLAGFEHFADDAASAGAWLRHLGTLTMSRIKPSGQGKQEFNLPSSPTQTREQALRLPNAKLAGRQPSFHRIVSRIRTPGIPECAGHSNGCRKKLPRNSRLT